MILQLCTRRIAAAAVTGQQQQQQHRLMVRAIQNNTVLRQLPIGHSPNRIRSSTILPFVQQLTNQMLWSQQQQGNATMMRPFMPATLPTWTRIPEPSADMKSSTIASTETTTSRSMISVNLECGVLEEDDDG